MKIGVVWLAVVAFVAVQSGCFVYQSFKPHDYTAWHPDKDDLSSCEGDSPTRCLRATSIRGHAPHFANADDVKDAAKRNREQLNKMYQHEVASICAVKTSTTQAPNGRDVASCTAPLVGLGLSGGGIRSASFAQGVLKGLHEMGLLSQIGYMSTVSGGGYTGGWFVTRPEPNDVLFAPGGNHLYHLAQFGNYLVPGHTSTAFASSAWIFGKTCAAGLPLHCASNILFDHEINTPYAVRDDYQQGIIRGFLYKTPAPGQDWVGLKEQEERAFFTSKEDAPGRGTPAERFDHYRPISYYQPTTDKPYWIIDMTVSLRDDPSAYKAREGDLFEMTPHFAGSTATGYVSTESVRDEPYVYGRQDEWWMTAEFGVAASGAAVDSDSLHQPSVVSHLIEALNYDLGYYIRGFNRPWMASDYSFWRNLWYNTSSWVPFPLSGDMVNQDHRHRWESKKLKITDGGHFDNLGLYSLIRRGVRLIIIADANQEERVNDYCDALEDKDYARLATMFGELGRVNARVSSDFGVKIEWNWDELCPKNRSGFRKSAPAYVMSGAIRNLPVGFPSVVAQGTRPVHDEVRIIYIKAAYENDSGLMSTDIFIDAEKAAVSEFPHRTTADQWYSEQDVLSYRRLGEAYTVGAHAMIQAAWKDVVSPTMPSTFKPAAAANAPAAFEASPPISAPAPDPAPDPARDSDATIVPPPATASSTELAPVDAGATDADASPADAGEAAP